MTEVFDREDVGNDDARAAASTAEVAGSPLLRVRGLVKRYPLLRDRSHLRRAVLTAVDNVDIELGQHETLGIVGESGCGKSTLGRCVARLQAPSSGSIEFDGVDITQLSRRKLRPIRANLQMIFQDPYDSLNPRRTAGDIVAEPLLVSGRADRKTVDSAVRELFDIVGLRAQQMRQYPHEFSGGQRQRIGIARALAVHPKLVIADEPVSALDVSIQAQILNLLTDLQKEFGLSYMFIAHDLGVVYHISDRVAVMYLGEVVELADAQTLFASPTHPYTEALLAEVPDVHKTLEEQSRGRSLVKGEIPDAIAKPAGCAFAARCPYAQDRCTLEKPALRRVSANTTVACHFPRLSGAVSSVGAEVNQHE